MSETSVIANLSPSDVQRAATEAAEIRIRATAMDNSAKFVASIKSSAVFYNSWDELLSAAPMSISLFVSCLVAASSSASTTVTLVPPNGGFKYLNFNQLRPNMIQLVDTGRECFRIADTTMDFFTQFLNKTYNVIDDVISDLSGSPEEARDGLRIHMDMLKRSALDFKEKAVKMDAAFGKWLAFASELLLAAEQTMGDDASKKAANELYLKIQDILLVKPSAAEQSSKKAVEALAENLKVIGDVFKKASDEYPSGWEFVGVDLVSGLCNCSISAANALIQKSTGNDYWQKADNVNTGDQSEPQKKTLPKYWDDPAYIQILAFSDPINTLRSIVVGGSDGGIDWDGATLSNQGKSAKGTLVFLQTMFKTAKSTFVSSGNPPSTEYQSLLDDSLTLVSALITVAEKKTSLDWKAPDPKSEQVKQWQAKASDIFNKASALSATAKTMSGVSGTPAPLLEERSQNNNSPSGGSLAEKALSSAVTSWKENQAAMVVCQELCQKSTENLVKIQASLGDIKGQLEKLTTDSTKLEQIRAILFKSTDVICDLKVQVGKLVQFFDALATLVTFTSDYHVTPFLAYLDKSVGGLPQGPGIDGFTFGDLHRQNVFSMSLLIRGYYSVFNSTTQTYGRISKQWIMPGMAQVAELSAMSSNGEIPERKRQNINRFTAEAQEAIYAQILGAQQKMLSSVESRIKDISNETRRLPQPLPAIAKAIDQGSKIVSQAAQAGIVAYKPASAAPLRASP